MKKNFIYALVGCLAFSLAACSDDPLDATNKHVYGPDENPYIKTNTAATISTSLEFPVQRIDEAQMIYLSEYADKFHSLLGMTVDEAINGLSSGSVVFYPMNMSSNVWMRTSTPTKGTYGWHYNAAGGVCDASAAAYSVEFDAAKKAIVVSCNPTIAAGVYSFNVGFAKDNGKDLDEYVRISNSFSVTDPSKIVISETIPFTINFADHKDAIEVCTGLTIDEFIEALSFSGNARYEEGVEPTWAMYLVNEDGSWDRTCNYTAYYLGYWLTADAKVTNWGNNSCFYAETSGNGDCINFGYYSDEDAGKTVKFHYVYANIEDESKYIEFIITATIVG